jgi:hypothetical protein
MPKTGLFYIYRPKWGFALEEAQVKETALNPSINLRTQGPFP